MTDYHPLIARAVEGLDRSTGEARRALYERARNALVAQLRSNQPALSEADITKERLALEEAIRRVEAEAARKSRNESRAEQRTEPRAAAAPAAAPEGAAQVRRASGAPRRDRSSPPPADLPRAGWTAVLPSARERLLSGRSSLKKQGVKGFRDVVGEVHDLGAATAKAVTIPVIGGFGGGPWLDGRMRMAHAAIGYAASSIDSPGDNYANVAGIVLDAISAYACDVRAARQIKGAAPNKPTT